MSKQEYMQKLQEKLESFGKEMQEEIMEDYRQHFAEGEKEGKSEEEIIEELGNIEEMIRELSEDELPEEFAQRTLEPSTVSEGQEAAEENADNFQETEMKRAFSYSGYYKAVVLEGKVADVYVTQSENDQIHVDYEAKGLNSQQNYEYYQYEEDGTFYAGVKRKKGIREEGDSDEKMVKVTLFGRTIISYGTVGSVWSSGQSITLTVRLPKGMPKLTAKVGSGNVSVSGVELEALEATSGSGNVRLNETVADRLKAHAGSGNVTAYRTEFISGVLEAGSGNVKAEEVKGRELRCGTGSGNIKGEAAVGEFHLASGSGNIKMKADGKAERVSMSTGSGSIKLELEGIQGMDTTVRTGSGGVRVAWNEEEGQKVKNGNYTYGNGACKIKANTGSGSIKIFGRE
ncbi:MAG: DUF4097 family beta strand repeat protein [Lachnospiraceae bacterium]|nr:DUF4097 family beta strand repeat protein [Lachnospiraceae bacterium]